MNHQGLCPIRLAGTWKQDSTKAIPQLSTIVTHKDESSYFECPYQAKVMKMLDTVSKTVLCMDLFSYSMIGPESGG
jgi:hypothetical protein